MKLVNIEEGEKGGFVNRITTHFQKVLSDPMIALNKILENHFYTILLLIAVFMFTTQAIIYILFGNTWYDEAGYLYESWLICDQGWIPYHDMYIKITPVLYYVYGIVQHLFGPSFYIGRLESVIFCALMLIALYKLSAKIGGKMAGTIAVLLIVSNTFLMRFYSSATAYSLTTLFMISSLFVLASELKNPLKTIVAVILMCLSFLTRQNMAPVLILLILYIILTEKDKKTVYSAISTAIIFPLLLLSPFLIMDFENTYSTIFGPMFSPIYGLVSYFSPTCGLSSTPLSASDSITFPRIRTLSWIGRYCYLIFVLFFSVAFAALLGKKSAEIKTLLNENKLPTLLGVMFIISFLVHLSWGRSTYVEYALYSIPLAVSFVGIGIARFYQEIDNYNVKKIFILVIIFSILITPISLLPEPAISNPLEGSDSDIQRIQRAAEVIELYTQPDDKIFTIDDPHYVFLAKRTVFPPLTHRLSLYTTSNDTQRVERRHRYNLEMVDHWLSGDADAVIFQNERNRKMLSRDNTELLELIDQKREENYKLVATVENAYPRQYARGNDTISIYLRKDRTT